MRTVLAAVLIAALSTPASARAVFLEYCDVIEAALAAPESWFAKQRDKPTRDSNTWWSKLSTYCTVSSKENREHDLNCIWNGADVESAFMDADEAVQACVKELSSRYKFSETEAAFSGAIWKAEINGGQFSIQVERVFDVMTVFEIRFSK